MIEEVILSSLVYNEAYTRKVLPYIKKDYFPELGQQIVHKLVKDHYLKYNKTPSIESLQIDLAQSQLQEKIYEQAEKTLSSLKQQPFDDNWLLNTTEEFCKRKAFYNAISKSAELLGKTETTDYGSALELVQDALGVSFDPSIGHDYFEDALERHLAYKTKSDHLPCDLAEFNDVTLGGFQAKTMTVFIAPTGVGKTLFMCHFAASFLEQGKNVLYITLEMTPEKIAERLDAHLMDVHIKQLPELEQNGFMSRIAKLKKKNMGKLVIKQYPGKLAHSGHFRHLLNELKLKKNFKPDVIFVDYLGICGSATANKGSNTHDYQKAVAEEIRGLGIEFDARIFTAVQVNREGTKSSDFEITDTAESWGIPATADYMYGIIVTAELAKMNQVKIKRLKDRYNDYVTYKPSFIIGIDRSKMRLYDVDGNDAPEDDDPVMDHSRFSDPESANQKSKFESLINTC